MLSPVSKPSKPNPVVAAFCSVSPDPPASIESASPGSPAPPGSRTLRTVPLLCRILLGLLGPPGNAADSPFKVEPTEQPTQWTVLYQGRKLMVYATTPQSFKPYVKELCTLKGDNLLRDAPHDHLHHHALMYGIKVNGVNFWEETPGCGVQKVVGTSTPEYTVNARNQPQAILRQVIHWVTPEEAFLPDTARVALLIEQRTLTLTVTEGRQEVALHWRADFEAGTKTNQVTLGGANYHGLGMRFLAELDGLAAHRNADGPPDLSDNRQEVTPHAWGSVAFAVPGKPATIAIFGHPSNARNPATFFTMRTPFAYLSATQGLDKEPLVYRSGERFRLSYLITLYPDLRPAEALQRRAQEWQDARP